MWVQCGCFSWWCLAGFHRVHWWQAFRLQDLKGVGSGPLVVCPCLLSALSLCLWCITLEYGSISRFKGVFSGVYSVCVGLCCLGALRGLWGFCTRVELGGLKACGVFASVFPIFCPSFCPFRSYLFLYLPFFLSLYLLLVLLSFVGLVAFRFPLFVLLFSLWVFVFSFSLTDYTRKERAQRFCSLRPLFVCCGLVYKFLNITVICCGSSFPYL